MIKYQNNDGNFSFKIEAIVLNVGNRRIWEVLLIAELHLQINSRLELNTEYIINYHADFRYIFKFKKNIAEGVKLILNPKNRNLKLKLMATMLPLCQQILDTN